MAANPWEGAEAMTRSWLDAQRLVWQSWTDLAKTASPAAAADTNPFAAADTNPFAETLQTWQNLSEASLKAWQGGPATSGAVTANPVTSKPVMNSVAERVLAAQNTLTEMMTRTLEAWQSVLPHAQNGDWQQALNAYSSQLQEQMFAVPTHLLNTSADTSELWNLYLQEMQKFGAFWSAPGADGVPSSVTNSVDRFWNAFDQTWGRAVDSPTLGYSREFNTKLLNGFSTWTALRRAEAGYQTVMGQIWLQAFDAVMKTLVQRAQQGDAPVKAKDLVKVWIETADDVFVREFGRDDYIKAQGELLNATMRHQIAERAVLEAMMRSYGLPTRSELDETHESLYELRRELRALKSLNKEVTALQTAQNGAVPAELDALKSEVAELRAALSEARNLSVKALENLPLADYGSLSVADISAKLENLTKYELEQLRAFELLHKNRKTLLLELDRQREEA